MCSFPVEVVDMLQCQDVEERLELAPTAARGLVATRELLDDLAHETGAAPAGQQGGRAVQRLLVAADEAAQRLSGTGGGGLAVGAGGIVIEHWVVSGTGVRLKAGSSCCRPRPLVSRLSGGLSGPALAPRSRTGQAAPARGLPLRLGRSRM